MIWRYGDIYVMPSLGWFLLEVILLSLNSITLVGISTPAVGTKVAFTQAFDFRANTTFFRVNQPKVCNGSISHGLNCLDLRLKLQGRKIKFAC